MNRSNVGNVVTNGMQILSVAAHNAGGNTTRVLGQANKTLNNTSDTDAVNDIVNQQKTEAQTKNLEAKTAKSEAQLKTEQLKSTKLEAQIKNINLKNDKLEKKAKKQTVDELMDNTKTNSPQTEDIKKKIRNDYEFVMMRRGDDSKFVEGLYRKVKESE